MAKPQSLPVLPEGPAILRVLREIAIPGRRVVHILACEYNHIECNLFACTMDRSANIQKVITISVVWHMAFDKLQALSASRRKLLPFVESLEDCDILAAIGAADEAGSPLGFKQLNLLELASPSTLQRRLKRLLARRTIKRVLLRDDGRRVAYSLTARTLAAYNEFMQQSKL